MSVVVVVRDALGREVRLERPPTRIVSLVPSESESVVTLVGLSRLVGRTEYCEEPAGRIEAVPTVGGTKKHDARAVVALAPDLVLANQDENGRADVEQLIAAGLTVHVSFPCTVEATFDHLRTLAALLGAGDAAREWVEAMARASAGPPPGDPAPVFVPIWRDPWMTFDGRTYASDLLARAGGRNVFADRARRFPLAAERGEVPAVDPGRRDTRYPRTTPEEIVARAPSVVLLPDEPYAFGEPHGAELRALGVQGTILPFSGKDLFWYGVRTAGALARLRACLDARRCGAC